MKKDKNEEILEHWAYNEWILKQLLTKKKLTLKFVIGLIKYYYIQAMKHGYGHGLKKEWKETHDNETINPNAERNEKIIMLVFGGIFASIFLVAYDKFIIEKIPLINHWLDMITLLGIIFIALILGFKYLFEEIL